MVDAVVHQDDLALLERRITAAGSHRHRNVGRSEARRIVHAVAHHGDLVALFPKSLDGRHFVLRREPSFDLVNSDLARHRFGGVAPVAGEHNRLDAADAQPGQHVARLRADFIP